MKGLLHKPLFLHAYQSTDIPMESNKDKATGLLGCFIDYLVSLGISWKQPGFQTTRVFQWKVIGDSIEKNPLSDPSRLNFIHPPYRWRSDHPNRHAQMPPWDEWHINSTKTG